MSNAAVVGMQTVYPDLEVVKEGGEVQAYLHNEVIATFVRTDDDQWVFASDEDANVTLSENQRNNLALYLQHLFPIG